MTQRGLYCHLCEVRSRIKADSFVAEARINEATLAMNNGAVVSEIDDLIHAGDCHIAAESILTTCINQLRQDHWEEAIQINNAK